MRATQRIADRTRYSVPVVEYALDRLFFPVTESALLEVIAQEIGVTESANVVAAPAGSVCIISSRSTIGVALWPALFALCAKCEVLVKDREDDLIREFFATLAEELPHFESAATAQHWSSTSLAQPQLEHFDTVVAFGSDETLRAIAAKCKSGARFVPFGSRASAGYVTAGTLADKSAHREVARGAARDLVLYETEGCMSLHVLFLERAKDDERVGLFMEALARALDEANVEFPPSQIDPARAAATGAYHRLAAFRAAGGHGAVYGSPGAHAVVLKPNASDAPPFLPRTIDAHCVPGPQAALDYLQAHGIALEAFALSQAREDVVAMAMRAGAVRVAPFGELQQPPLHAHHGGRPRITDFIRWIDITL